MNDSVDMTEIHRSLVRSRFVMALHNTKTNAIWMKKFGPENERDTWTRILREISALTLPASVMVK